MKPARELVCVCSPVGGLHLAECNRLTAAIEARDAEHAREEQLRREIAVESDRASLVELRSARSERDSARAEVKRLREEVGEVVGLIESFATSEDSTEELDIIHDLSAWADAARKGLGSPATPVPALPVSVMDPATVEACAELVEGEPYGESVHTIAARIRALASPTSKGGSAGMKPGHVHDFWGVEATGSQGHCKCGAVACGECLGNGWTATEMGCFGPRRFGPCSHCNSTGVQSSPQPTPEPCPICHDVGLVRPRFNRGTLQDCPRGCKGTVTKGGTP